MRHGLTWVLLIMISFSCKKAENFIDSTKRLSDILVSKDQWLKNLKFDIEPGFTVTSLKLRQSTEDENKAWVVRKGMSRLGNCITESFPLVKVEDKFFLKLSGIGDRCAGIGCTDCSFTGNGCECLDIEPWRKCKHSRIKISDIIRLKDD